MSLESKIDKLIAAINENTAALQAAGGSTHAVQETSAAAPGSTAASTGAPAAQPGPVPQPAAGVAAAPPVASAPAPTIPPGVSTAPVQAPAPSAQPAGELTLDDVNSTARRVHRALGQHAHQIQTAMSTFMSASGQPVGRTPDLQPKDYQRFIDTLDSLAAQFAGAQA